VEVKNEWSCTSSSPYIFMAQHFVKYRDNFTSMTHASLESMMVFQSHKKYPGTISEHVSSSSQYPATGTEQDVVAVML
jgi:hypothetical protein